MSSLPKNFIPTSEQLEFASLVKNSRDSILLSALAGAAKTTTLIWLAETVLRGKPILCLAFNAAIAKEMQERMPGWATCVTFNGLGYRTLCAYLGLRHKQMRVDGKKMRTMLTDYINSVEDETLAESLREDFMTIAGAIDLLKNLGYYPDSDTDGITPLDTGHFVFDEHFPDMPRSYREIIDSLLRQSFRAVEKGYIDYNDQVYVPALLSLGFAAYPVIMVDEAQDLSPINHKIVEKCMGKRSRLIAVGDRFQAIYGFRGADPDSMDRLKEKFEMMECGLTTTFRCSKLVADEARWRAPYIKTPQTAKGGKVQRHTEWSVTEIPEGAFVLCPFNAPLFKVAMRMIIEGMRPELRGNDMLHTLADRFRKFTSRSDMTVEALEEKLQTYGEKEIAKTKSAADRIEAMRVLSAGRTLQETLENIKALSQSRGTIRLLTIHKSKGLETEYVALLDTHLIMDTDRPQDDNLLYVAQTRSMDELHYFSSGKMRKE